MFPWLGEHLTEIYGPFRLLTSRLFLIGLGTGIAACLTWYLLPRLWHYLPHDQGRLHAVDAHHSVGKPVGAGMIFIPIFMLMCLLVVPIHPRILEIVACVGLMMLEGFMDDRRQGGWSEYRLAVVDLAIALLGAIAICQFQPFEIWFPLFKGTLALPPWIFIPLATGLIWLTINATNCCDGVDGLSGSLSALAFVSLGSILYGIVGHEGIASYLLVPHYPDGALWGMLAFVITGCLAGYLWHNAQPSAVLMGDAGSRPIGFLLGVLILASGNPFLVFVVASVVLVNGATGLLKVALLRFFRIRIFKNVRYPLHDHVRQCLGWSNAQVLVRFVLIQAVGTPLFLLLLLKVR